MPEKQGAFPAALCGTLTALSENYGTICSICCALILLDLLTGLAKAKIQGKLNSDTGYKGFWRKAALLAALAFGICLDLLVEYAAARRPGSGVPRPDRAAARLLHRRQRVHLHHRKPLGLRCPAARFSRRSSRKRQGQARPALTPAFIIPVPESAVNPAPAGSSSLAALAVRYKILMLWRLSFLYC